MFNRFTRAAIVAAGFMLALAPGSQAQQPFTVQQVGTVNTSFTAIVPRPGDREHAFALTRSGIIHIVANATTFLATPLLDFHTLVASGGESGALGLAFDPDYQTNGYFYICYTAVVPVGSTDPKYMVARYTVSPPSALTADPASRTVIMPLIGATQSVQNHNGGWIGFGPDNLLYISRGEGPVFGTTAQNPTTINGKILRIDVRGDDFPTDPLRNYAIPPGNPFAADLTAAREVFIMGLRNPWRCSFDRLTGSLWIGDVGTNHEEIDLAPAAAMPPVNLGWPCYDGNSRATTSGLCAAPSGLTAPLVEFNRTGTATPFISTCLTGGIVYRGCEIPAMRGRYIYGGCTSSPLSSFNISDPAGTVVDHTAGLGVTLGSIYTFGEDAYGEVYIGTSSRLYRMLPLAGSLVDCNANGRADACEIADGSAEDINGDGIPDSCTRLCPADFDASGQVNVGDIFWFLNRYFSGSASADINGVNGITVQDIFDFLAIYFQGCP
jgi:glucose/arabinose dehydrogenase